MRSVEVVSLLERNDSAGSLESTMVRAMEDVT